MEVLGVTVSIFEFWRNTSQLITDSYIGVERNKQTEPNVDKWGTGGKDTRVPSTVLKCFSVSFKLLPKNFKFNKVLGLCITQDPSFF